MRIATQIIAVIAMVIILITIGISLIIFTSSIGNDFNPVFELNMNSDERTLTVGNVNLDLNWEDIEVSEGSAILPDGIVKKGDVISNCYGSIKLTIPGYPKFGGWAFRERSTDDLRFYGTWENAQQQISFDHNGNYNNNVTVDDENASDVPEPYSPILFAIGEEGEYDADDDGVTLLSTVDCTKKAAYSWGYRFEDRANYLYLLNQSIEIKFKRAIFPVVNYSDIENYSYQKVNVTGNLCIDNETIGYLSINKSNISILISFEGYNESNLSDFDGQEVQIIGYIYQTCDCDFWDGACIKEVELITLVN